ncbi:hypothetical protein [Nonomuraea maritima]
MTLSGRLQDVGVQLELLTGIYDPNSMGAMFFDTPRSSTTTCSPSPSR